MIQNNQSRKLLFTLAHLQEGRYILEQCNLNWERKHFLSWTYFESDDFYLLVMKEGVLNALQSVSLFLNSFNVSAVVNFGIVGAIRSTLEMHAIVNIRDHYFSYLSGHEFHSFTSHSPFQSGKPVVDCVSSAKKILKESDRFILAPIASVVDREAYGSIKAAKTFKLNHYSFKIVSDFANNTLICQTVKDEISNTSELLGIYVLEQSRRILNEQKSTAQVLKQDLAKQLGLFLTFSQRKHFDKILSIIIRNNIPESLIANFYQEVMEKNPQFHQRPKELTKIFLSQLSNKYENLQHLGR